MSDFASGECECVSVSGWMDRYEHWQNAATGEMGMSQMGGRMTD